MVKILTPLSTIAQSQNGVINMDNAKPMGKKLHAASWDVPALHVTDKSSLLVVG
jgi:hypothetical protein